MIRLRGQGASGGVARGPLYVYRRQGDPATRQIPEDAAVEKARFVRALEKVTAELNALAAQCRERGEEEAALLREAHAMLAADEDFIALVTDTITAENRDAAYAVRKAGDAFAAMFEAMDDPYLRARSADIRDVTRRILDSLTGSERGVIDPGRPAILVADELSPSEMLRIHRTHVLGVATRRGSPLDHTAILARSMGIPAVFGLGDGLRDAGDGTLACIDGERGLLILSPDADTLAETDRKEKERSKEKALSESVRGLEDVTADGRRLEILCAIGSPDELPAVTAGDGRGIGLFRTEFLCLAAGALPSEEEQFEAYKAVAAGMEGRRVIIRTFDFGGDKRADGLPEDSETPSLRTQLRALYRASAFGNVAILFPLITTPSEVRSCGAVCASVRKELADEGIPFNANTKLGVMIETPGAVLSAGELAKEADFFSIGTNDLTRRATADEPGTPAVLRAIRTTAEAARENNIPVYVCGEAAADPALLPAFLAAGIDGVCVPPSAVLPTRLALRRITAGK